MGYFNEGSNLKEIRHFTQFGKPFLSSNLKKISYYLKQEYFMFMYPYTTMEARQASKIS